MKEVLFAEYCQGIGMTHVVRDCDLTETIGFYKNEYQIYYILEGERFFYWGNQSFRMIKGTLSFIDKDQIPFTNVIGGKFHERILIELEEEWLALAGKAMDLDLIDFFRRYHGVLQMDEARRTEIENLLRSMEIVMTAKKPYATAEVKSLVISLFLAVLNGAGTVPEEYHMPKGKAGRYIKVREIINYIIEHYAEVYGLEDLAGIFYLDKSYLSRIFKEVTNFTVNEFINSQRIGHARNLLLDESLSMEEVSRKLGYERLSYFDRVFKSYVGMSPLQYRKSKLGKNQSSAKKQSI